MAWYWILIITIAALISGFLLLIFWTLLRNSAIMSRKEEELFHEFETAFKKEKEK